MTLPANRATLDELAARLDRHDRDGEAAALLDEAVQRRALELHAAVLDTPDADAGTLRVLGRWFLRRYHILPAHAGQPDLRNARLYAGLLRDLGDAGVPDDLRELLTGAPDIVLRTNETALSMLEEFDTTGDEAWVLSAANLISGLEQSLPAEHPIRHDPRSAIFQLAWTQFTIHADPAQFDALVRNGRAALAGADLDHPDVWDQMAVLAWGLLTRYEYSPVPADLDEALRLMEDVVRRAGNHAPANVIAVLASGLRLRFERTRSTTELDRAVMLGKAAVRALPSGHPMRAMVHQIQAMCLIRRFEHLDREADLTEAIELSRAMRPMLGPAGPQRCTWLATLAMMLAGRGSRTGEAGDLDEAVSIGRESVDLAAGLGSLRHWILANCAVVLSVRFTMSGRREDLTEAIGCCRSAIAVSPDGVVAARYHTLLARLLTDAAQAGGAAGPAATADLDEAVSVGRRAIAQLSPGHPHRCMVLSTLADTYHQRYRLGGAAEDLDAAVGLWRSAARSPVGKPDTRMQAVRAWYGALLRVPDLAGAAEAAATGVSLLPMVAWRGLGREGQERRLARLAGMTGEAAALEIELGRPEHAVELIEQGRAVLWSQAVQTRGDLTALRAAAPKLAQQLDDTRHALNRMATNAEAGLGDQDALLRGYRKLAERWDVLLGQARALPGFADFLGATPFATLRAAAAGGPVVIVNVTRLRCDALIVRESGVRPVRLRWLSLRDAHRRAEGLLAALDDVSRSGSGPAWTHLRQTLDSLLRWLWDVVAAPVLEELDRSGPGPHRMWWCLTGPLTLLPLHAAGRYGSRWSHGRRPTVPDRTVSSYTTGLGALIRARARPVTAAGPTLLAVGMPATPDRAPLPAVVSELDRITALLPGGRTLIGAAATPATVLAELARHPWAHFACHATQRIEAPGESALHLTGGDLSVLRFAAEELPAAEFAYLSACRTAAGSMKLADEAINLAAALQLAGYRHVIGTSWPVADEHAATVADAVYRTLTGVTPPDAGQAAGALAAATAALRREFPDRPEIWAPFVHLGP